VIEPKFKTFSSSIKISGPAPKKGAVGFGDLIRRVYDTQLIDMMKSISAPSPLNRGRLTGITAPAPEKNKELRSGGFYFPVRVGPVQLTGLAVAVRRPNARARRRARRVRERARRAASAARAS
jgi:hypothetical protein